MLKFFEKLFAVQNKRAGEYFSITMKRSTGSGWMERYVANLDELADLLKEYTQDKWNLYFCPTPLSKRKRRRESVSGSRLLWADLDEANPEELPKDLQPTWAWETSPGRYACLWALDKRIDDLAELEELNRWLTYKVGADPSGWDLTQVLRIPGTTNHKYPGHPVGRLLWHRPRNRLLVDDLKKRWGKGGREVEENEAGGEFAEQGGGEMYRKWKSKIDYSTRKLIEAKVPTQGKRSEVLWLLENKLAELGIPPDDVVEIVRQTVWNKFRGRRDEAKRLKREVIKLVGKKLEDVSAERKLGGGKNLNGHRVRVNGEETNQVPDGGDIAVTRLDRVEAEAIEWLWYPYIPLGKITMLEGNPGIGKSWILYTLAAHFSLGKALPESKGVSRVRSLICSVEDHVTDTMKNRLNKLGGDHKWIYATNQPFRLDEDGILKFEQMVIEYQPKIVFFDPLFAYMGGGVDMFRANETREVLSRVQDVAVRHKFAAVCVRHLTKGDRGNALYRGQGSIDITAAARSVLVVGQDPDDDSLKVFMQIKNNLGPLGSPINFTLDEGSLAWGTRRPDISANSVMNAESTGGGGAKLGWVRDWLKNELEGGAKRVADVESSAEKSSIARMTLRRAREELKVKTERRGKEWYWELPDD